MSSFHGYERCYNCSGRAQPGTRALLQYLIDRFPETASLGIYNCRNVRGGTSMSIHACGRALDLRIPMSGSRADTSIGNPIIQFLIKYAREFGLMGIIYNRVRYDAKSPRGRYYGGVAPHYDHAHIEQRSSYATSLTRAKIEAIAGPANSTQTSGGLDMFLFGLDIGKMGADSVKSAEAELLQATLLEHGYGADLGNWGEHNDGVDGSAGDDTRRALHRFKIDHGIDSSKSAGEGKIGSRESAALVAGGGGSSASAGLTQADADDRYAGKGHGHELTVTAA